MKLTPEEVNNLNFAIENLEDELKDKRIEIQAELPEDTSIEDIWGPDTFGEHELLDRLATSEFLLFHQLYSHGAIVLHPEVMKWVLIAGTAVNKAYSELANFAFGEHPQNLVGDTNEN